MSYMPRETRTIVGIHISEEDAILKLAFYKAGLKITTPRMLVLKALIKKKLPISVEDLIKSMSALSPNQATIYRILNQAVEMGIAEIIHFKDGISRYEAKLPRLIRGNLSVSIKNNTDHCHHVVCKGCGKITHIHIEEIEDGIQKQSVKIDGFPIINEHTLDFFGFCTKCSVHASIKNK